MYIFLPHRAQYGLQAECAKGGTIMANDNQNRNNQNNNQNDNQNRNNQNNNQNRNSQNRNER